MTPFGFSGSRTERRILLHSQQFHNCWLKPSYSCKAADLQAPWAVNLQPSCKAMSNMAISQARDENSWSIAYLQQFPNFLIMPYGHCYACAFFSVDFHSLDIALLLFLLKKDVKSGVGCYKCLFHFSRCYLATEIYSQISFSVFFKFSLYSQIHFAFLCSLPIPLATHYFNLPWMDSSIIFFILK